MTQILNIPNLRIKKTRSSLQVRRIEGSKENWSWRICTQRLWFLMLNSKLKLTVYCIWNDRLVIPGTENSKARAWFV